MADQVKPSKFKREARKKRFKLIMPGGDVDTAFTRLFAIYKKLDDRLNGEYKAARDAEVA